MKKWTKTALLTGCACCIAGAVLMFSGWASGGKAYAETYDLNAMSGSAKKEDGISTQKKIKLDDFDELQTDLAIGDLRIRPVTIPVISPGGFRRKKERLQWNIACGTVF